MSVAGAPSLAAHLRFDPKSRWRLHPQVALREESFGALAYHYGNRRLVFLRSRLLVELVQSLERFGTAAAALDELIGKDERSAYEGALERLAGSGVIDVA